MSGARGVSWRPACEPASSASLPGHGPLWLPASLTVHLQPLLEAPTLAILEGGSGAAPRLWGDLPRVPPSASLCGLRPSRSFLTTSSVRPFI